MDDVRETLDRLIRERRDDYAGVSRLLGRNPAYIQQFIRRGVPRKLDEDDRRTLARYFEVDEALLGGPDTRPAQALERIPLLDIGASAGPGAVASSEQALAEIAFDRRWLRLLGAELTALSLVRVRGDSMAPTLADGDQILVDRRDATDRLRDGIYVLRIDDAIHVKRVALRPGRRFAIVSDNDAYPPIADWHPDQVAVIGRVIWVGRRLS